MAMYGHVILQIGARNLELLRALEGKKAWHRKMKEQVEQLAAVWRKDGDKTEARLPYHCLINKEQCRVLLANLTANFPLFEQMLQRLWRVHREWHQVGRDVNRFVGLAPKSSVQATTSSTCIETSQNDQLLPLVPPNQNLDTKRQELAPGHQESERKLFFHVIL